MEKGNCGDVEVAHICSKTCNVLACNQQVRRSLLLTPHPSLNAILCLVTLLKKYKSRNKKAPKYSSKENFINFLS